MLDVCDCLSRESVGFIGPYEYEANSINIYTGELIESTYQKKINNPYEYEIQEMNLYE